MIGVIPVADNPECSEASDAPLWIKRIGTVKEFLSLDGLCSVTRTEHEYNAIAFLLFVETFGSSECKNKISTSRLRMEP